MVRVYQRSLAPQVKIDVRLNRAIMGWIVRHAALVPYLGRALWQRRDCLGPHPLTHAVKARWHKGSRWSGWARTHGPARNERATLPSRMRCSALEQAARARVRMYECKEMLYTPLVPQMM